MEEEEERAYRTFINILSEIIAGELLKEKEGSKE